MNSKKNVIKNNENITLKFKIKINAMGINAYITNTSSVNAFKRTRTNMGIKRKAERNATFLNSEIE
ncbi:MAG: hypothetical protein KGZ85_16360 [Ignavibacterium sp.]|nr:hypothetical protein [Ignavibacterium sp.]